MPPLQIATPLALWGLLSFIPVIILYILKPKPRRVQFPSIMFILRVEKSKRFSSFLKKIVRDPLLFIQLFLLGLIVLAAAGPYTIVTENILTKENAVIVIDSSASMQSADGSSDRFGSGILAAKNILERTDHESRISIVLAENVPIVLGKHLDRDSALQALDNAFPSDTPSNIADSILFCRGLFTEADENRNIYVISDYSWNDSSRILLAQKVLAKSNISVTHIRIGGRGGNTAVTELNAKRFLTDKESFYLSCGITNYRETKTQAELEILVDGNLLRTIKLEIPPFTEEHVTHEGKTTLDAHRITLRIKTNERDDLDVDDEAYFYLPEVRRYHLLLLSDEGKDTYLRHALESSRDISFEVAIPPVVPKFEEFDAVIIGELKADFILPGTFRDLKSYVDGGGRLIVLSSDGLAGFNNAYVDDLMPVSLGRIRERKESITIEQDHEIFTDVVAKRGTTLQNIITQRFIEAETKNGSSLIASVDGSAVMAYRRVGEGTVFFNGLNSAPEWSNFYYSSKFPIFWIQLINWITREESVLGVNNFHTGDYLPVSEGSVVKTPSGASTASRNLVLDERGFYEINKAGGTEVLSVSLLDPQESNIGLETEMESMSFEDLRNMGTEMEVLKDVTPYVVGIIYLAIIFEGFYYRRRGLL